MTKYIPRSNFAQLRELFCKHADALEDWDGNVQPRMKQYQSADLDAAILAVLNILVQEDVQLDDEAIYARAGEKFTCENGHLIGVVPSVIRDADKIDMSKIKWSATIKRSGELISCATCDGKIADDNGDLYFNGKVREKKDGQ